jgi:hypothetical protein
MIHRVINSLVKPLVTSPNQAHRQNQQTLSLFANRPADDKFTTTNLQSLNLEKQHASMLTTTPKIPV